MIEGFRLLAGYLDAAAQRSLVAEVLAGLEESPPYHARMPRTGQPMSVAMTNFGPLGWWSDPGGYRYVVAHPETGRPWPEIPRALLDLWDQVGGYPHPPEACLVNIYREGARLGLHVDADEDARDAPVVSVSLGDRAVFRLGGLGRRDPTRSLRLASGDVCVLGGASRRAFHGVDRIVPGSSTLVPGGGRINLTLRRVTRPAEGSRNGDRKLARS
jgi:DNA oxidative demethylase